MTFLEQVKGIAWPSSTVIDVAPGRVQILDEFYHADGDPLEMYLTPLDSSTGQFILTDLGMTLMRLSYSEELTDSLIDKVKILVSSYGLMFNDGSIEMCVCAENFKRYVFTFAMTITRVMALPELTRKREKSVFYEQLSSFVKENLTLYNPVEKYKPLPERDELVDFRLTVPNKSTPIFLYPVRDGQKATNVWGQILLFLNHDVCFRSLIVCDNFEDLSKKDQFRLTNDGDRIIFREAFEQKPKQILERLAS